MMKVSSVVNDFIDLIFPRLCPGCDRPYAKGEYFLCTSCDYELPLFELGESIQDRFRGRISILDARAFLKFHSGGLSQKLLHAIKYNGDKALAEHLGGLFMSRLLGGGIFNEIEVIVPVPLHPAKLRSRGYNQSEILAQGMAKQMKMVVDVQTVSRTKKSETQTRKTRAERWHNVSGIFKVTGNGLKGKNVLLIDDVITTGATLEACGAAISSSGVKSLSFAAMAAAM